MRRAALLPALFLLTGVLATSVCFAQASRRREPEARAPVAAPGGPPHAWLFGVWTGGLFPVLDGMTAQDCKMEPTVVFARDQVNHASLLGTAIVQRVIETVRTTPAGAEFRFTPDADAEAGFGCEDANVLHVTRENDHAISFPHCTAFPYPLERCPRA